MRHFLLFMLRLARAVIVPRRAAIIEAKRAAHFKDCLDVYHAGYLSDRQEWASERQVANDQIAYWRVEAAEHKKESDSASLALKLCREELAAAHVQIDATAKIIHALNEQRMMDARIAATRAQGPPSNADLLGRVLD